MKINWIKKEDDLEGDNEYFSDNKYEFIIFKKDKYWILSYTDFWTDIDSDAFFVNIKKSGDESRAVPALKRYADQITKQILENRIKTNNILKDFGIQEID